VSLPWDRDALSPARWKLAIGVTIVVLVFLFVAFGSIAAARHRNDVIARLTEKGWASVSGPSARLSIQPETDDGWVQQEPTLAPLVLSGSVDGERVNGEVEVSRWPPWGSAGHVTVAGERWTLRLDLARDTLTVTTGDGLTIVLQ
jgi:hypothetical protein